MHQLLAGALRALLLAAFAAPAFAGTLPTVRLDTSLGVIDIELDSERAPVSVDNFLAYVADGHYDGLLFHRVDPGFMIQGGGFTPSMEKRPGRDPIVNEADNGLPNLRGTVAMARTNVVHSATAQFFINLVDNAFLDHRSKTTSGWGYAVFGRVTNGMEVVDAIAKVQTGTVGSFRDVPREPVMIRSATLLDPEVATPQ